MSVLRRKANVQRVPQLNLKFNFRRVYILSATKMAASAGVPYITPKQVSWSG